MAAVAYTKVTATQNQLVYSWTGDVAGTLAFATLLADATAGSPLRDALVTATAHTDSNAKATAALLSGAPFTGTGVTPPTITTNIQSTILQHTGATAVPLVTAVDSGVGDTPDLVITVAAAGTGLLFITQRHSIIR